jgi:uncharacterized protein (TIGR00255 family)
MTGFGSSEKQIAGLGRVSVEMRSLNHKFFETVLHLPQGFLSLEENIKKEIGARIKRGRVTCVVNILGSPAAELFINRRLIADYLSAARQIRNKFALSDRLGINTLMNLPGVLSVVEKRLPAQKMWPQLNGLIRQALVGLVRMRQKEGWAMAAYLKREVLRLRVALKFIRQRFQKASEEKLAGLPTEEERAAFLKGADITEELERLEFHVRNFLAKFSQRAPAGKELDFIIQEMQREANTMGAKSCDTFVSGRVVELKSQIEKLREQVQNIE